MPIMFLNPLVPTLRALSILACAAYLLTARRIICVLKSHYSDHWHSLGCPEAIDSLISFRAGARPESGRRLNAWLAADGHLELQNSTLTVLAPRLRMLRVLSVLCLALAALTYEIEQQTS